MAEAICVLGAGQAGLQLCELLRTEGAGERIVLIGDEQHLPYQRPPLSKQALISDLPIDRLIFRKHDVLERRGIEFLAGVKTTRINRDEKCVELSNGQVLRYSKLAVTTGSAPRVLKIPGAELPGIHTLRTIEDSHGISAALASIKSLVVIGGGFIGLEVAAAACKRGVAVTVLEALPRLMARAVSPVISDYFLELHRSHGVDVRLETAAKAVAESAGRVDGIVTGDGSLQQADAIVVGIGIEPNDALAAAAGLACERGVIVDDCARTSDPDIVSAGDCTARRLADGSLIRLESVQNAIEQARSGAAALCGKARPFIAAPYFWSEQFEAKLQMTGTSQGHDESIVRGDMRSGSFSVFYYRSGAFLGCDSVNRPQDHGASRRALDAHITITPDEARDDGLDLAARVKRGP